MPCHHEAGPAVELVLLRAPRLARRGASVGCGLRPNSEHRASSDQLYRVRGASRSGRRPSRSSRRRLYAPAALSAPRAGALALPIGRSVPEANAQPVALLPHLLCCDSLVVSRRRSRPRSWPWWTSRCSTAGTLSCSAAHRPARQPEAVDTTTSQIAFRCIVRSYERAYRPGRGDVGSGVSARRSFLPVVELHADKDVPGRDRLGELARTARRHHRVFGAAGRSMLAGELLETSAEGISELNSATPDGPEPPWPEKATTYEPCLARTRRAE